MPGVNDIVITGIGCVTPIGIGRSALWKSLVELRSGVRRILTVTDSASSVYAGAPIDDFDAKQYVTPRKAIKVMGREVQLAYAAAHIAWRDAQLDQVTLDPDRVGVVFGSEMMFGDHETLVDAVAACSTSGAMDPTMWGSEFSKHIFPLWMLRSLPNMPACHVGIAIDARGPNNTLAQEEVSGLLALSEATHIIERDQADVMVVGAVGSRLNPARLIYRSPSLYNAHPLDEDPPGCIPFDKRRSGIVPAEGSAVITLERRSHAVRRGAVILGQVLGVGNGCGRPETHYGGSAQAIAQSIQVALNEADCDPSELSHVSAQGFSAKDLDRSEAAAILSVSQDIPVSAFSSFFGTAGASSGLMNLVASLLAAQAGVVLPVLGYNTVDDDCPLNICRATQPSSRAAFLTTSFTPAGHAAAAIIQCNR
jgi:3-oxoacyl-[acyl-carrier-protein] synthase II